MEIKKFWPILCAIAFLSIPLFVHAAVHTVGTNVLSNGTVFMVTADGHLRPYTSAGAFLSYGFNSWTTVVPANPDDLTLPVGEFIPPRDGKIICSDKGTDKGTCYLITNGKKAGFVNEQVFIQSGFNFKYVSTGDVSFLPTAANISDSAQAHLAGTLINDNGTIKIMGVSGTVGIPDMSTLNSWGYSLTDVVNANTADKAMTQTDVLPQRTAGELAWSPLASAPQPPPPPPSPNPSPTPGFSGAPNPPPTPTTITTTPFAGNPYLFFLGTDQQTGKIYYDFAINLATPATLADQETQVYTFWCVTPNNPNGISSATRGLNYYSSDTIISSIYPVDLGVGHYTCSFKFNQGTYVSNPVNFDFDGTNLNL